MDISETNWFNFIRITLRICAFCWRRYSTTTGPGSYITRATCADHCSKKNSISGDSMLTRCSAFDTFSRWTKQTSNDSCIEWHACWTKLNAFVRRRSIRGSVILWQ